MFDIFVEKIVLHNRLATQDQIDQAKAFVTQFPQMSLLDVLVKRSLVTQQHADFITQKFQQHTVQSAPTPAEEPHSPAPRSPAIAAHSPSSDTVVAEKLRDYLHQARKMNASDLHINTGCPPLIRKDGKLSHLEMNPLTPAQVEKLLFSALTEEKKQKFLADNSLDTSLNVGPNDRYRLCLFRQKSGIGASFRLIDSHITGLGDLGLPEDTVKGLVDYTQGLVLVTGPSGSGKSTTVASLLETINQKSASHIITLEDPIEYVYTPIQSHFTQRQLGDHTESFSAALRGALREDPDVIMIGELRDYETASLAITAAETGHLVISTLDTTSAAWTINRVLDLFPANQKQQVRMMLAESLRGIICQKLIPHKAGKGRVLAYEILISTYATTHLIKKDQLIQLSSVMMTSKDKGMKLMDATLQELVKKDLIDGTEAYFAADNKAPYVQFAPKNE